MSGGTQLETPGNSVFLVVICISMLQHHESLQTFWEEYFSKDRNIIATYLVQIILMFGCKQKFGSDSVQTTMVMIKR